MDKNYIIYEGPSNEFEEYYDNLEQDGYEELRLSTIVRMVDSKGFLEVAKEIITNDTDYVFVARAEEFFSVKEHFIENLLSILNILMDNEKVCFSVMHNPPKFLVNKLISLSNGDDSDVYVEREIYCRPKITKEKLKEVIKSINSKIYGQEEVLYDITAALYTSIHHEKKLPIVLMFYGQPGVGKTETAKIINSTLSDQTIFRQQLSMFKTNEFYNYLFGSEIHAPSLAKDLMRSAGNVILFDEFNQCPQGLYSAFFQMFDEGEFEDINYKVDLSNTVIICTANFNTRSEIQSALGAALFSRFTAFIKFNPLSTEAKEQLIKEIYYEVVANYTQEDKENIEQLDLLNVLIQQAPNFSNSRNIKNGVELYLAKYLSIRLLEQTLLEE
ncbi:AAA family ATPase [Lysinibacillus sp. 1 U-2021]|uniref:AAA family ATPase n=1 Tax=Lysinibacillus sp. 1 U-2021 TaxID=3039426 RepID=UPI0024803B9C|nr:AAA family ATPase [Lysinibacillus sp. 1 U-2021]WGT37916.1 AAA family ATPase [Lysinibacillus sp. 1 U-2021]